MGLDWTPLGRPRPGMEREFHAALGTLTRSRHWLPGTPIPFSASDDGDVLDAAHERLVTCQITPYETLGAPRVGHDAVADAWAREQYAAAREKPPTVEEWMWGLEGYWVVGLLPASDGMPDYGDASLLGRERFELRGKFLEICVDVIGEDLSEEGHLFHLPDQLAGYGRALMAAATAYAEEFDVAEVLDLRGIDHSYLRDDTPRNGAIWRVQIAATAARWALWWSARGHGLNADW